MSETEIFTSIAAIVAAAFAGWTKYRSSAVADELKVKEAEAAEKAKEAEQKEQERLAIIEDRRKESAQRNKEYNWLTEQQKAIADRWYAQYTRISDEMNTLRKEHIECRQESAVLASRLEDALARIVELERKQAVIEGGIP